MLSKLCQHQFRVKFFIFKLVISRYSFCSSILTSDSMEDPVVGDHHDSLVHKLAPTEGLVDQEEGDKIGDDENEVTIGLAGSKHSFLTGPCSAVISINTKSSDIFAMAFM